MYIHPPDHVHSASLSPAGDFRVPSCWWVLPLTQEIPLALHMPVSVII